MITRKEIFREGQSAVENQEVQENEKSYYGKKSWNLCKY